MHASAESKVKLMAVKTTRSGKGSASVTATKLMAAKLEALPWFDKAQSDNQTYVGVVSDLAPLDKVKVRGDDAKSRRKNWRRAVRNAVKAHFPEGDDERDWQMVDGEYILPFGLVASLDENGVAHIRTIG